MLHHQMAYREQRRSGGVGGQRGLLTWLKWRQMPVTPSSACVSNRKPIFACHVRCGMSSVFVSAHSAEYRRPSSERMSILAPSCFVCCLANKSIIKPMIKKSAWYVYQIKFQRAYADESYNSFPSIDTWYILKIYQRNWFYFFLIWPFHLSIVENSIFGEWEIMMLFYYHFVVWVDIDDGMCGND
jgi:hypothetical protein